MRLIYLTTLGALFFFAQLFAHEGHDHKEPMPILSLDQNQTQEAATDTVELVLKHQTFELGKSINARLFLSTADENKPVANAKVEFEFAELNGLKIEFVPEKGHPGIYSAAMRFPKAGIFDATVSVSGEKMNDLLTLAGLEVRAPLATTTSGGFPFVYALAGLAVLIIFALIVIMLIRRRRHA